MNPLPILAQNSSGVALVEVDGQAVITASDLAKGLEYKDERSVRMIYTRHQTSFRDFGLYDLTREDQIDPPCSIPKNCDTAIVRFLTPGRADGLGGGGLQDVRVFTKRGALKICMKSNQPKAVQVQEMLIDLYEKVESGQLIGSERFGRVLTSVMQELTSLKQEISHLKAQPPLSISLPDDTALPVSLERRKPRRPQLSKGLRHPEIRELIVIRFEQGTQYADIVAELHERYPDEPEKHVTRSALSRFYQRAALGYLKELGIDMRPGKKKRETEH